MSVRQVARRIESWMPSQHALTTNRWLRPLAPLLADPIIWRFNRRTVARGVALGLFFGLIVPFAQTFFAALFAVSLRANLAVAAFCTFISNPFTTPLIYYGAYEAGLDLLGRRWAAIATSHASAGGWIERLTGWLASASAPTALGLALLSVLASVLGYALILLAWRGWIAWHWSARRQRRLEAASRAQPGA